MAKKIFYEKVGKKYVPVWEYNSDLLEALPRGNHMIMSYPGGKSTRYNIEPNYAAMIAAGRIAENAISSAIMKSQEMRPQKVQELTSEQHAAWTKFVDTMGDGGRYIQYASAREAAEVGVKAMQEEALKLMSNPAVKLAYEHFLTVAELTKEQENT